MQASNISDALVRPQAAAGSALEGAGEECYDDDGNPQHVQHRVPELLGPPVHPVQVRVDCACAAPLTGVPSCRKVPAEYRGLLSNLVSPVCAGAWCMQAVRCVEVISLLMKQHLRGLVKEGLQAYLQLWQEYAVEPGSLAAYAGKPGACTLKQEPDRAHCVPLLPAFPLPAAVRQPRHAEDLNNSGGSQHQRRVRNLSVLVHCAGLPASLTPEDLQASTTDDANLAWRVARQQQLTAWGSDLFCPCPAPMFQLQLLLRGDELLFVPGLQEVQHTVLGIVDAIIQAGQAVEDLGAKVSEHCSCGCCLRGLHALQCRIVDGLHTTACNLPPLLEG